MWVKSDLKRDVEYVIQFCHEADHCRTLHLRMVDEEPRADRVFETGMVSYEQLMEPDVFRIAGEAMLKSGREVKFDAHGVWFTREEIDAIWGDARHAEIPWCTGRAPRVAPK